MTKWINNDAWNALLGKLKTADQMWLLSSYTENYSTAQSNKLGGKAYSLGTVSFPASGEKKITLPNITDIPIERSGTVNHVALVRAGGSEIIMVVDVSSQTVAQNGKADVSGIELKAEVA
nr:MAG TPA: hypothetical protein [Caudoviricetes sp.]